MKRGRWRTTKVLDIKTKKLYHGIQFKSPLVGKWLDILEGDIWLLYDLEYDACARVIEEYERDCSGETHRE